MDGLLAEIKEQPQVLGRLLREGRGAIQEIAGRIAERRFDLVLIAARGTSDNAATYAKYLFGSLNRLPVALAAPSLHSIYKTPPAVGHALVIGISQSGKSPDIVSVLADARRQGAATLAITNTPGSELARTAEWSIDCQAGEERAVAATKTYTAQLLALALLSVSLSGDQERLRDLARVPDLVAATLAGSEHLAQAAERYRYMEACAVIGRGYNYATALEIALKLKELTYTTVTPYSSADFMHGPIAVVERGFPLLAVAPSGVVFPDLLGLLAELQERQAELIVVSDSEQALRYAQTRLALPAGAAEWLSPIVAVVPGQLLAYHLALAKGLDPEHPRGLRKVTETL